MDNVLGSARTGLIFTRIQEGSQLGGLTLPNLVKQSRVFHTMCRHAGFLWGGGSGAVGTHSWFGRAQRWLGPRERFCSAGLFCVFPFFCIFVVTVPFVCCSVKLPLSRPTTFLPVSFHSPPPPEGEGAATWQFFCRLQPKPKHGHVTAIVNGHNNIIIKVFGSAVVRRKNKGRWNGGR